MELPSRAEDRAGFVGKKVGPNSFDELSARNAPPECLQLPIPWCLV